MFLLDDLLLAPGKGAYLLFQELARKAQEDWLNDDTVKQELQQLNEMLEGGSISEKEFEAKECRLLERLEQIARIKFQDKWGAGTVVVEPEPELAALPPADPAVLLPPPAPPAAPPPGLPPVLAAPPPQLQMQQPPMPPPMTQPPPISASVWPSPPPRPQPPPIAASAWPAPPLMPSPPPMPAPMLSPPPLPGTVLTMGQIIDCAVRAVSIMKMRVSSITAAVPDESGWRVSIELVERRGVPDTSDVLGLYEVRVDAAGNVLRYERTQMRRRGDFGR